MFAVPIGRVEVLHPVGFEQDGAVDELGLFGAGVVPERVAVPERDVGWVLERAAAVSAGGEGQELAAGVEATVACCMLWIRLACSRFHIHVVLHTYPDPVQLMRGYRVRLRHGHRSNGNRDRCSGMSVWCGRCRANAASWRAGRGHEFAFRQLRSRTRQ